VEEVVVRLEQVVHRMELHLDFLRLKEDFLRLLRLAERAEQQSILIQQMGDLQLQDLV
jgi:hypothetical protein